MTGYPGNLTPNRQTHYSQRDVDEARGSLTLLKKRMSNSRDRMPNKNSTIEYSSSTQQTGRMQGGYDPSSRSQRNQNSTSFSNAQSVVNHGVPGGNVPPRPPRVNQSQVYNEGSGLMMDSAQSTPGDHKGNYRKVFKPNIPAPRSNKDD